MSKLQELRVRIEKLPGMREAAAMEGGLGQFASTLEKAASSIVALEKSVSLAELVFGESGFRKPRQQRTNCSEAAQQLKQDLTADLKIANSPKMQKALASISILATGTIDLLGQIWASLVENEYNQFQAVARWADSIQPSDRLQIKLDRIRARRQKLPENRSEAEQVRSDIDGVRASFKRLGLEGKVKEFIEKALAGNAPAEMLRLPEIEEFIKATDLWKFLRVRLGN
jgi:hypothetical protein